MLYTTDHASFYNKKATLCLSVLQVQDINARLLLSSVKCLEQLAVITTKTDSFHGCDVEQH